MGYRIVYEKEPAAGGRRGWLTAAVFCLFLAGVWIGWPEGREVLERMLWPVDSGAAAEVFAEAVECGLSLGDAAELFCRELLGA